MSTTILQGDCRERLREYREFLAGKRIVAPSQGVDVALSRLNPMLFPFQARIVQWALAKGRSAIFADCGLGKTPMQLEWGHHIHMQTGGNVLILAPLAVSQQTVREGDKFGVPVHICRRQEDTKPGLNITNYEMLQHFDPDEWAGLVLDESGILKSFEGTYRQRITEFASRIRYRLACTATPAPNDLIEIENHSEYLGVMDSKEVTALFFTQDGNTSHNYRLKGHAKTDFYRWLASWSVALRKPSDIGEPDGDFTLPSLTVHEHVVKAEASSGRLFPIEAQTLSERLEARRDSIGQRVEQAAELVNSSDEPWVVWCNLNAESEALVRTIPDAVEVRGSDSIEHKERSLLGFVDGKHRVLVTKPRIAGFGLNLQHCRNMAFVGLSDSFEEYYQATLRCWRYGQTRPVHAHVIISEAEGAVVANIQRKEHVCSEMMSQIVSHMSGLQLQERGRDEMDYREDMSSGEHWTMHLGDNVEVMDRLETDSIGLTVTSPPFPGLYVYSNSTHDMGNSRDFDEMLAHFRFLVGPEKLLRVTMPGRLACIHLQQSPTFKWRDGVIGLQDFRGKVIQVMQEAGWIYHGEATIDKNPQAQATRTKERGLMFKTLVNDSANMRMALADYLIQFRKPGDNPRAIRAGRIPKYGNDDGWITDEEWIEWAAPVWYRASAGYPGGIRETDVLNVRQARETDDERHLAPLQLGVYERAIKLWTAPGDTVLDPFAGIGSGGVVALPLHRRFVGIELKASYYRSACENLSIAEAESHQPTLFGALQEVPA